MALLFFFGVGIIRVRNNKYTMSEKYQATKEEIKKAESMLTEDQKKMSAERFRQKEEEIIETSNKYGSFKLSDKLADFEEEKTREMKKSAPLFFIYRNNTLFKKYIPIILKNLNEMGRQVDVQIFPEGTQGADIERWYQENKELLSKKAIISDRTADIPHTISIKELKYELGARNVGDLDELINRVFKKIIFGNAEFKNDGKIETSKEFMIMIVKNILKNQDQWPKKVLLLRSNMGDHFYEFDEEKLKEEKKKNKDYSYTEEAGEYIVAKVKEWLIECGLKPEQVEIVPDIIREKLNIAPGSSFNNEQIKFLEKLDQPNTWIITDRHTRIDNNESETSVPIYLAVVLKMPLGDFFNEVKEHNLIYFSEEEIGNEFKKMLIEEFVS